MGMTLCKPFALVWYGQKLCGSNQCVQIVLLGPPGASWGFLGPSGASGGLLGPPGAVWGHLGPPGVSWGLPASSGRPAAHETVLKHIFVGRLAIFEISI